MKTKSPIHKNLNQIINHKFIALVSGLFLLLPHITSASFQSVEINEINYTGYTVWADDNNTDFNDEFIELKNANPNIPITLDGWTLRILSGLGDKSITLSGDITDYLVIRKITSSQSSLPSIDKVINITTTNFGSLSNDKGAYIELRDNKGSTIDAVNFFGKWPSITSNPQSLHKVSNLAWEVKPHSPLNIVDTIPSPTPAPNPEPEIIPEPEKTTYGGVIISEIYPDPIDGQNEFVELYNTTDRDIDLKDWKLDDIPNAGSNIQTLTGFIPAKGFLLLQSGAGLKIGLNNAGDSVILYDPEGKIQSQVDYIKSQKGSSYMFIDNNWIWNPIPSPNAINIAPIINPPAELEPEPVLPIVPVFPTPQLPSYSIGSIIISEVYPDPIDGQNEFVELYNTTDRDIDLKDWKISDLVKNHILSGTILAKGIMLLEKGLGLSLTLNNTGDSVILYDPEGKVQSQVDYTMKASQKGSSYMFIDNNWLWNPIPSPNAINIAPIINPPAELEPEPVLPTPQLPSYSVGSIIISEIYPNPIKGQNEFVELYNTTNKDIDLKEWKLDDIPNAGSKIQTLSGSVPAKGFMLLEAGAGLKIILNNDQDSVILYDPEGKIQSQVDYTMKASQKGSSYMFIDNNWFWNPIPSPNAINTSPILLDDNIPKLSNKYPIGSIIVNELYPYPSDNSEEFIEIYNTTSQDIDITGWKISDLAKTYMLSGIIPAKSYKTYIKSETKIALNNTSETVTLIDTYNQIQSSVSYSKAYKGLSYIPILQGWGWTQTITPNSQNIFTDKDNKDSSKSYIKIENIEQLAQIEDGEYIEIQGQIIIPAGTLLDNSLYIIKDNRVVKIYDRQKRFPNLNAGDVVQVKAEWHKTETQQYLKTNSIDNINIITEQELDIKSQNLSTLNNSDWGKIVNISGQLDTNTKTKLVLNYNNQSTSVKLYPDKITKPKMKKGDLVQVMGFIEIYDGEIRVIPWNINQIKAIPIIKKVKATTSKGSNLADINNQISIDNIMTENTEYIGLDEFQLPGTKAEIQNNQTWYRLLWSLILEYKYFSVALVSNLIWWVCIAVIRYRKINL